MRCLTLILLVACSYEVVNLSAEEPETGSSLEDALLEDLGEELLKPTDSEQLMPQDDRLLQQLGEDIGEHPSASSNRLSKVITHMKTAQTLLKRRHRLESASDAQAEALTGIEAIIVELSERQKRSRGGQSKKPDQSKPGQQEGSKNKAGKSPAKSAPSASANNSPAVELTAAGDLVKDLWGKLHERQRQQIMQPLSEEFLPKYASEIEAYFRTLADPRRNTSDGDATEVNIRGQR